MPKPKPTPTPPNHGLESDLPETNAAVKSGNWSDPSIWKLGHVPEEGENVPPRPKGRPRTIDSPERVTVFFPADLVAWLREQDTPMAATVRRAVESWRKWKG